MQTLTMPLWKAKYPGALLLFRVGDFYETFGQDAVLASKALDIVLTNRNGQSRLYTNDGRGNFTDATVGFENVNFYLCVKSAE